MSLMTNEAKDKQKRLVVALSIFFEIGKTCVPVRSDVFLLPLGHKVY